MAPEKFASMASTAAANLDPSTVVLSPSVATDGTQVAIYEGGLTGDEGTFPVVKVVAAPNIDHRDNHFTVETIPTDSDKLQRGPDGAVTNVQAMVGPIALAPNTEVPRLGRIELHVQQ